METDFDTDNFDTANSHSHEINDLDDHCDIFIEGKPLGAVNRKKKAHTSTKASSSKATTLNGLLSCPQAPSRGLFDLEDALKEGKRAAIHVQQEMRSLAATPKVAEDIYDKSRRCVHEEKEAFESIYFNPGISNNVWTEYEAFCESLEHLHSDQIFSIIQGPRD